MNAGGAETFLMKLYRRLDKTGYQMDFCINVAEKCDYEDEVLALGGRIYRIPMKTEKPKEFQRQLTHVVRENGYRNVLRVTSSAVGFWDLKIAKEAGATRTIARSSNASDGDGLVPLLAHKIGRRFWMDAVDVKIAPSDLAAIHTFGARAYQNGEVALLRNGLDLDVYRFDADARRHIRAEFGFSDAITVIGHVGRFNQQKNHAFLIELFSAYHAQDPNAKLLLVGEGTLREEILRSVEEKNLLHSVIFAGLREDVPAMLSAMDVLAFPSFYEGMPNVVIEAQATGLPCVISDAITREADVTGLVRYVSLDQDAAFWAEAVRKQAALPRQDTRAAMISAGYDIDSVLARFIALAFGDAEP